MKKYRKKPVIVEAIKYVGYNHLEMKKQIGENGFWDILRNKLAIRTLEGNMVADLGDYIIKGIAGEFYPCKPEIFEASYEEVEE